VRPIAVRLEQALTRSLNQKSDLERRRLKSMVELLHHYEIQVAAHEVQDAVDAEICGELGIDLADGQAFGEPLPLPSEPLPDTSVLGGAELDRLFAAGTDMSVDEDLEETLHGGTAMFAKDMAESSSDSVI
jgi:EAL domain-containing protein (putative c-di-GMP-specific phosphodiesterase class I)